jgi:AcrR family transcriptional regulator
MAQITQRAGVGVGTLYNYFESKELLVNILFQELSEELGKALFEDYALDAPARERFFHLFGRLAKYCLAHPREFQFLENYGHSPYLNDETKARMEATMLPFAALFSEPALNRSLPPSHQMKFALGAVTSLVKAHVAGKLVLTEPQIESALAQCWIGMTT